MKQAILFLSILFILPLMFLGCAQNTGDNPEGDTGGDDGYGVFSPNTTAGSDPADLVGFWRHDYEPGEYETVEINDDGTLEIKYYIDYMQDDETHGTYSASETELYVILQGGQPQAVPYTLSDYNHLIVEWNNETVEYYRVTR